MFGVVWGKGKGNVKRLMLIALASAILTLLMIATPGCWSARELDKRAIVVAMGIDKAKEPGKLEVSYQIIKPAEVGAPRPARGGEGQGRGVWVLSTTGDSLFDAAWKMSNVAGRRPFWGHLRLILFSEALAREGLGPFLDVLARNPMPRRLAWLAVARGCLARSILEGYSELEKVPAETIMGQLEEYGQNSTSLAQTLHGFLLEMENPGQSPAASAVELVSKGGPSAPNDGESGDEGSEDVERGRAGAGGTKLVPMVRGAAVFKRDRLVGWLDEEETRGLLWVTNRVRGASIVVDPLAGGRGKVTLEIVRARSRIRPEIKGGVPHVTVEISASANLAEQATASSLYTIEHLHELERELASAIENEVRMVVTRAQRDLRTDVFGFGLTFYRKHPRQWKAMAETWEDAYFPHVEVNLDVNTRLDVSGLIGPALKRRMTGTGW